MRLNKNGVILVFGILLVLLIAQGCAAGRPGQPRKGEITQIDYHTGSQGLVLKFLPGSPPQSLYKGDPLNIVVEYSNKGAYDVSQGYLYISGYDKSYITFTTPFNLNLNSKGKSEFNPLGELSNTYEFNEPAVSMPSNVDIYSPKFLVTACYKYKTEAFKEVCIDPDPFSVAPQEKVCVVHDVSFGTQGAPVAVNSVEETTSNNRVQFRVHVSNVGGGTVIDNQASIADCHTRLKRTDIDKLTIRAKFSDKIMKCEPEVIQLVGGSGISICSYDGNLGNEAYLTVLDIELFYGYRTSIQGSTNIYRIPGRE